MPQTFHLIFVDDEPKACALFARYCAGLPYTPHTFSDPVEALSHFREHGGDLLITDIRMPGMDGIELLGRVREIDQELPVIIITAHTSADTAIEALRLGAMDFIKKPFIMEELLAQIDRTLHTGRLQREVQLLRRELRSRRGEHGLIGDSPAMHEIHAVVEKIADVRCNVIIQGESGTGKELLARYLHESFPGENLPFVAVDCGALNDTLLESELFGHEKGAFTGAVQAKRGLLEVASGGTLFLDEIGNISDAMQIKLLRVIQEGQVVRVGGTRTIDVDVRWLVATNQDLEDMSRTEDFRPDLYHRLNVVKLTMPPLHERREDIPMLLQHFLEHFETKYKRGVRRFGAAAVRDLMGYRWPGNVRELRNIVERHVVMADGADIDTVNIPKQGDEPNSRLGADWPTVALLEQRYIEQALQHCGGNQRQAAELLGIDKSTLWRKLQHYKQQRIEIHIGD